MPETDEERKKREKDATLAGLKKRAEEGEKEREIVSGRGTEQVSNYDKPGTVTKAGPKVGGTGYQERETLKIAEPKPGPSPSPASTGKAQADVLRKAPPAAATTKSWDEMPMSELAGETSLAARAAYNRRKQKGEK